MIDAVILFAHGARDPAWARPFEDVAAELRRLAPALRVQLAYLEFMAPDLPTAGHELVAAGCRDIRIVPLFLGAGGHVRRDLPALVSALQDAHPSARWHLTPAIGERASVVVAMAEAALQLTEPAGDAPGHAA